MSPDAAVDMRACAFVPACMGLGVGGWGLGVGGWCVCVCVCVCVRVQSRERGLRKFWYLSRDDLIQMVTFDLTKNMHVSAAGQLRHRLQYGVLFFGTKWGVYQGRHRFRALGKLNISDEGLVFWTNEHRTVSMCQFRDNILLAFTYPDSPQPRLVHTTCQILQQC